MSNTSCKSKNFVDEVYIALCTYLHEIHEHIPVKEDIIIRQYATTVNNTIYHIKIRQRSNYYVVLYDDSEDTWHIDEYGIRNKGVIHKEDINKYIVKRTVYNKLINN